MVESPSVCFTDPKYMEKATNEKLSIWPMILTLVAAFVTSVIALVSAFLIVA